MVEFAWSDDQRRSTAKVAESLLSRMPAGEIFMVGLSGAPGSGKSSLARLLVDLLAQNGVNGLAVSLDDYYLGKQERIQAAKKHPLFAQRGVPGTHDWTQLIRDLDRLKHGESDSLLLPQFDKMKDDRADTARTVSVRPEVVVLEGWLIGAPPQPRQALDKPVNQLEASQDTNGQWRHQANDFLRQYHRDLLERLDAFWFMSVPNWESVVDWRWQQEQQNADSGKCGFLKDRQMVAGFLAQFQRLAMHMQDTADRWADVIINIDSNHILSIRD